MNKKHLLFVIIASVYFVSMLAVSTQTELGQDQGIAQSAGQISFSVVLIAAVYYGLAWVVEKKTRKVSP